MNTELIYIVVYRYFVGDNLSCLTWEIASSFDDAFAFYHEVDGQFGHAAVAILITIANVNCRGQLVWSFAEDLRGHDICKFETYEFEKKSTFLRLMDNLIL